MPKLRRPENYDSYQLNYVPRRVIFEIVFELENLFIICLQQ